MFDLKQPCVNCPFRRAQGELFGLGERRVREIAEAVAFQCHKTIDYSQTRPRTGERPQQCAGLMTVLHRSGAPNVIMQVGRRLGHFDPALLDPKNECYASLDEAIAAHKENWR